MRYLYKAYIHTALNRGEQVEQFLRCTAIDSKTILSWLTLRKADNAYIILHHKQHDQGLQSHASIYEFKYLFLPKDRDEPEHLVFESLETALAYASKHLGASHVKWVRQGGIQDEYTDYKLVESLTE